MDYFFNLFGTARDKQHRDPNFLTVDSKISAAHSDILLPEITNHEIKNVLFEMRMKNHLGWMVTLLLSLKNWNQVGPLVCEAFLEFFRLGSLFKQWNHTIISLIPKTDQARNVGDYHPIACCNVSYNIITKILASRLSLVFPYIIDKAQVFYSRQVYD